MRWLKIVVFATLFLFSLYAGIMYLFFSENKTVRVEREINYPADKVYAQFVNLQNFTRWSNIFTSNRDFIINYYQPYEGVGSSLSYYDRASSDSGELFIRYAKAYSSVKYQLFRRKESNPTQINVSFKPVSRNRTKLVWLVTTPKVPLLKRFHTLAESRDLLGNIDKSLAELQNLMGSKVEKEQALASVKYDSIISENKPGSLLLGVNVSTSNKGDSWYKNIIMNHNKVHSFVMVDLQKREDEIGLPTLVTGATSYKDREVSYFFGIPVSKRVSLSDNNFIFKTVNPSQMLVIYYKGTFRERQGAVQKLIGKAQKENLRFGDIQMEFLETPQNEKVILKISLPVFR